MARPPRASTVPSFAFGLCLVHAACGGASAHGLDKDGGVIADARGEADAALDAGGAQDAGPSRDASLGDASSGGLCAPCVTSADCASGLCLGGAEPRCGSDCSAGQQCPADSTCESFGLGKGPRLGVDCTPTAGACGAFARDPDLHCDDTWDSYGQPFFANTCIGGCHRHDGAWTTLFDVRGSADALRFSVETQAMPQAMSLSPAERLRFLTWLACGAP